MGTKGISVYSRLLTNVTSFVAMALFAAWMVTQPSGLRDWCFWGVVTMTALTVIGALITVHAERDGG